MIRHQKVLRIILARRLNFVITLADPSARNGLAFDFTTQSGTEGATTVPLTDQPIIQTARMYCTKVQQHAPVASIKSVPVAVRMCLVGAMLGLLGGCGSLKDFNSLPEPWRGATTEKAADQDRDIGARSRLQSMFSPYRTTVQQGNYITQDQLEQVRAGMTRNQVQFVLGQPLLSNSFRDDRWIYVFRMQWPDLRHDTRRVTVFFDGQQRVARVEADSLPASDDGKDPAVPGYRPPRANDR
jgi:outer membrane protein assembly factor BamE (lipoprotein component of BamABCDE complex)